MRSRRSDMALRSFPWTSVICLAFLLAAAEFIVSVQGNCKYFDFENGMKTLSKWSKTGHAFDNQPTFRDNANERDPDIQTNVQGDWWIGTFENRSSPTAEAGYMEGDYPIGTLTSPEFRIKGSNMDFLLGGGCDGENIRAELLVNGKVQRVAYADYCRERMRRRLWNVAEFRNQIGQIRLVDGSRKGHINFDDLRGDFTCLGSEFNPLTSKSAATGHEDEVVVIDEPSDSASQSKSEEKPGDDPITGTEEDYITVGNSSKHGPMIIAKGIEIKRIHNFSSPQMQEGPVKMGKGIALKRIRNFSLPQMQNGPVQIRKGMHRQQGLLEKAISNGSLSIKASPKPPRISKTFSATPKISKAPVAKPAAKVPRRDSANNSLLPRDDDLRNLTCKNFLVEIKTGLPWDNDFLFVSNNNYQSTRRDIELKVLNVYEDDKDFRGAFFSKFSSSKEPEGVKAYFILRFRAADTFLGKLLDKLGEGKIAAAGCYEDVTQCPSNCPSTCVPLCLASCCQPVPAPMPGPPPQPVPAVMPNPQVYQQPAQQWNNQLPVQATNPPAPAASSQFPMSQSMSWPSSQCASGCSPNCEPSCSPACCRFFYSKRTKTNIKSILKKKPLEEEKH